MPRNEIEIFPPANSSKPTAYWSWQGEKANPKKCQLFSGRDNISPYHYTHNNPLNRIDPTGRADQEDDEKNKAKTGAQGAAIATGQTSSQAANARQEYHDKVSKLDKKNSAGRKEAREAATQKTPEPFKSMAKAAQSQRGDQTGGTANKSNAVIDQRMKVVGAAGKGLLVAGAVTSVVNIATADDMTGAVVGEIGTWTGALIGGKLGAEAGTAIGGGIGAFFGGVGAAPGAVAGGIIGGLGGSIYGAIKGNVIATELYDDFKK